MKRILCWQVTETLDQVQFADQTCVTDWCFAQARFTLPTSFSLKDARSWLDVW